MNCGKYHFILTGTNSYSILHISSSGQGKSEHKTITRLKAGDNKVHTMPEKA